MRCVRVEGVTCSEDQEIFRGDLHNNDLSSNKVL